MESKPFWLSTTIQGTVIEVAVLIVAIFKIPILPEEIQTILSAVFALIGTIMIIAGRIKAKKFLGWSK